VPMMIGRLLRLPTANRTEAGSASAPYRLALPQMRQRVSQSFSTGPNPIARGSR
jgi:hypothetical protein